MTDFNEIYCLNLVMKNDPRLAKIPLNMYYSLCWKYLQVAISRFQYESIPDITDNVPFYEIDYEYECNGTDLEFQLNNDDKMTSPSFVINLTLGNNEPENIVDFEYDAENNSIKLSDAPIMGGTLHISEYQVGYFNVDLDYREKEILAQGMLIPYLEENQNRESLLNQFVYGGSVKIHSQAEHLKTIEAALKEQVKLVNNLIIDYSYRANLENYSGLGTRAPSPRVYPPRKGGVVDDNS